MDEVDGMSAGDRGGVAELIKLIKKTKVPIVCICNDRQSPKVRSLAYHCEDIKFKRPQAATIRSRIMSILFKEGVRLPANVIDELVTSAHSDIRQVLNTLSTWTATQKTMDYDQAKQLHVLFDCVTCVVVPTQERICSWDPSTSPPASFPTHTRRSLSVWTCTFKILALHH
jgi:DNA polymerase III delta prime subunit